MFVKLRLYALFIIEALQLHLARKKRVYGVLVSVLIVFIYGLFFLAPPQFPVGKVITISEDASTAATIEQLKDENIIGSEIVLKALLRITGSDRNIHAGKYLFSEPVGVGTVYYRITNGVSGIPVVRVTFPEGVTAREMGEILKTRIKGYDSETFVSLAKPYEGYLFPDTYALYGDISPQDLIELLRETFVLKTKDLQEEVATSGHSLEEIVIMASLLEKEAKSTEDRQIVSGILWSRIRGEMALQVDAVFGYIKNQDTYHPSLDDLEVDSPYNTYLHRGLPPGAIANPGLDALLAALRPIETDYVYYLTGTDGTMHYAETFEEHKANRERYLR
jgi:UPF0755 protein